MGKMIGHMTGSALCYSIWLGDELGLYRELAGMGPRNADSVAAKTECNARLVREWLDGQAAGGLVAYDPTAEKKPGGWHAWNSYAGSVTSDSQSPTGMQPIGGAITAS